MKCIVCHREINILPCVMSGEEPSEAEKTTPGNVYSLDGFHEVRLSGMCESCFDRVTSDEGKESDDEVILDLDQIDEMLGG